MPERKPVERKDALSQKKAGVAAEVKNLVIDVIDRGLVELMREGQDGRCGCNGDCSCRPKCVNC